MRFHHVGVACSDIASVLEQFRHLHPNAQELSETIYDPEQNAYLKLFRLPDGVHIEFIAGPMVKSFVKRHIDLYHTCFETPDFETECDRFVRGKAIPLGPARPALLFGGRRVMFFKTSYGIVELLEE